MRRFNQTSLKGQKSGSWRSSLWLLAVLVLLLGLPGPEAMAVEEPAGYRMEDYDAPVPETLTGAYVISDDAAHALWLSGRVAVIDVMPDFPRPKNLPKDMIWRGRARHSIPGAIWLTDIGYGELSDTGQVQFSEGLTFATDGDPDAPLLFVCRADCWLSWNAARRAVDAVTHGSSGILRARPGGRSGTGRRNG